MTAEKTKILIVGSGFGGVKLALELSNHPNFSITLVSNRQNFEYHAALYRSATGRSPLEVVLPLREIFSHASNVELVLDTAEQIDLQRKQIVSTTENIYSFDYAVLAVGQVANYYGIEGMDEHSFAIDTVSETIKLRNHLREIVEKSPDKQPQFVIVGAGASGVELAAELDIYLEAISRELQRSAMTANVTLIEGSDRVLPLLHPKISQQVYKRLQDLEINVLLNTKVSGLKNSQLIIGDTTIEADTVVWTAGAKNNPFFDRNKGKFRIADNSRVEVDEYMMANKDVYVIGDSANTKYAGMAQTALHDAEYLAGNLQRIVKGQKLKKYVATRPIYAVPVGGKYAVLQWGSVRISGYIAWILRRLADLRLFSNFEPFKKAIRTWRKANKQAIGE